MRASHFIIFTSSNTKLNRAISAVCTLWAAVETCSHGSLPYNGIRISTLSSHMKTKLFADILQLQITLITANHILHYNKVVDAYGHISFRDPSDPSIFVMSGDKAPALVASPADLIRYWVKDSMPVDPKAKKGYQERFIHSEIYKRFPEINSVVHSHSEAVLPYTMSGVPMKPAFHIAGFLGTYLLSFVK